MSEILETILRQPVGSADLVALDRKIARHESELDLLRSVRSLISARMKMPDALPPQTQRPVTTFAAPQQTPPPPPAAERAVKNLPEPPRQRKAAGGSIMERHRERIFDYLTAHGPATKETLSARLSIALAVVSRVTNHEWFAREEDLIAIATSN